MSENNNNTRLLVFGAWFGLVTGLVEGLGLLATYGHGWLTPNNVRAGVTAEIVWISALVNLALFLLIAFSGLLLQRFLPRVDVVKLLIPVFVFVACLDWLALSGRLGPIAVLALAGGISVTLSRWFQKHVPETLNLLRRTLPAVLAITVLQPSLRSEGAIWLKKAGGHSSDSPRAAADSPNVLVVVIDTVRADHLSLYGYPRKTSPHLDAIAKRGVVFENDIAASPWTLGSHASMLTGRYPHEHGVDHEVALDHRYPTLPEIFDEHGYRTGGFSANLSYFTRPTGLARGFLHFDDYFYSAGDMFFRTLWGRIINKYAPSDPRFDELYARKRAAQVNQELLSWVDQDRNRSMGRSRSLITLMSTEFLCCRWIPYHEMFYGAPAADPRPSISQQINPKERPYLYRLSRMSPQDFQHQVDAYDGGIYYADEQIANLFAGSIGKQGLSKIL